MASTKLQELITLLRSLPDRSGLPFPQRREEFEQVASQLPFPDGVAGEPHQVEGIPAEWVEQIAFRDNIAHYADRLLMQHPGEGP